MSQREGVWFRVLLYVLGLYICNAWLDVVPAHLFALYSWFLGITYLLFRARAWKDPLAFALCYGVFLGIQGVVWLSQLLAWTYGTVRYYTR